MSKYLYTYQTSMYPTFQLQVNETASGLRAGLHVYNYSMSRSAPAHSINFKADSWYQLTETVCNWLNKNARHSGIFFQIEDYPADAFTGLGIKTGSSNLFCVELF